MPAKKHWVIKPLSLQVRFTLGIVSKETDLSILPKAAGSPKSSDPMSTRMRPDGRKGHLRVIVTVYSMSVNF